MENPPKKAKKKEKYFFKKVSDHTPPALRHTPKCEMKPPSCLRHAPKVLDHAPSGLRHSLLRGRDRESQNGKATQESGEKKVSDHNPLPLDPPLKCEITPLPV